MTSPPPAAGPSLFPTGPLLSFHRQAHRCADTPDRERLHPTVHVAHEVGDQGRAEPLARDTGQPDAVVLDDQDLAPAALPEAHGDQAGPSVRNGRLTGSGHPRPEFFLAVKIVQP